jgi:hypothetical protein
MKTGDPSLKFVCHICGAQPQERCETNSGTLRFESHRERRDVAKEHNVEHLSAWHGFKADDRSSYPTVDSPEQVKYADGGQIEGMSLKHLLGPRLVSDSPITGWRYIKCRFLK